MNGPYFRLLFWRFLAALLLLLTIKFDGEESHWIGFLQGTCAALFVCLIPKLTLPLKKGLAIEGIEHE